MEDVKWLLKKWGFPMLVLLIVVIAGVICWGKLHKEEMKVAEEVWEPPHRRELKQLNQAKHPYGMPGFDLCALAS